MNEKFEILVTEIKEVLDGADGAGGNTPDITKLENRIKKLGKAVDQMTKDLYGHVGVYNKHIVQQHKKVK